MNQTQVVKTSVSRSASKNRVKSARSHKEKSVKNKRNSLHKTIVSETRAIRNLKNVRKLPPAYETLMF